MATPQINTTQAQVYAKNIASELMSLAPSALITLFEINISDLGFNIGVLSQTDVAFNQNTIFRFHNSINLTNSSIFWQGNEYIAAPISANGFEMSLKGAPVTPNLSITTSDIGITQLTVLKQRIDELGDIIGAKLTRIRTFARFLDASNFYNQIPPQNFFPDPNQELPRDIYYIDRLALENKNFIQYDLSSLYEVEGITLPGRIISESSCPFVYRGEGCLYEYANRKTFIHGDGTLPQYAPPVATALDEDFSNIVGAAIVDTGPFNLGQVYNLGQSVFIANRGINYYFVSLLNNNTSVPPNTTGWLADECSKRLLGCKKRWQNIGSGILPFGGFPSVNRFQ